ncbi:uncharacterized protein PHACADRAFT_247970 [Phanerochaete carnosa HHB-10118-sp]|uniref:Uncharacterized protein n=1 Tax=Phanerochaete carnosa (strain HHB-10118-sp) TaxID=650164 RepID=K5WPM3_PHACS|nr:uncharacterized protein PHACADRAFT_247970 [Phanerochaete carnosa HHB-10118-sp]EKM61405.1 hypothetical protein PHACADRAFT_247970 [Phanerochaete carnosa HHB-10118-sp]
MVVNNAGINCSGTAIDVVLDVVPLAVLRICKVIFPQMATRRSGIIVDLGSVAGEMYVFLGTCLL